MQGATVVALPVVPNARATARNLMRSARSSDPIVIAESIGLRVYRCAPEDALWAEGAQRGSCLLISEAVPAGEIARVAARLVANAFVRCCGMSVDRHFAAVFAEELAAGEES